MPVVMEPGSSGRSFSVLPGVHCAPRAASMRRDGIDIAIVNNMPDAALEATERQFIGLLARASDRMSVRVKLFALPGVPRSAAAQRYIAGHYADIAELWRGPVDGLIVTGTEPRAALAREPYWAAFTALVDWAGENTTSAIWSCLAAHAAVLHLDGIDRYLLADKCFGIFQCERVSDHPLTTASPELWQVPHSRWNDLPERTAGVTRLRRSVALGRRRSRHIRQGGRQPVCFRAAGPTSGIRSGRPCCARISPRMSDASCGVSARTFHRRRRSATSIGQPHRSWMNSRRSRSPTAAKC